MRAKNSVEGNKPKGQRRMMQIKNIFMQTINKTNS